MSKYFKISNYKSKFLSRFNISLFLSKTQRLTFEVLLVKRIKYIIINHFLTKF